MSNAPFSHFQSEIYLNGTAGIYPAFPVEPGALEAAAAEVLAPEVFGYVAGAAGTERSARANRDAFDRWRIVARLLRDVSVRDLSTTVLGTPMPAPVAFGPVGVQGIVHPDGEVAVARAAAGLGLPFSLSTVSSYTIEDVAVAGGDAPRWFQLYWPKDREVGASLLDRAAAAGFSALLLTLDTFILAWRPRDLMHGYLPFLHGVGLSNYFSDPAFRAGLAAPPEENPTAAILHWQSMFGDPSNTWADLAWVREHWAGPIAVKGILHPDDARRAVDCGMEAVLVSNHGGRQIDGSIAALEALPAVVDAVGGRAEVLFDSGIRTGSDVVKALALGAAAVLIGRPYIYGLGLGGEAGVRHVMACLLAELDLSMALAGCPTLEDVGPEVLAHIP
ncbi:MAG TPA: alpha-hydroxy-acid oxidizing protein [Mycobacteriales bacterium]|nr:alpha-hydroxy-acid oxidizing protein [Mycobacteriales bacterium]